MIPTRFSQLIGNQFTKHCLQRMLAKKEMGHALLFAGMDGIGKSLFAQVVAASLLLENDVDNKQRAKIVQGVHPDIHVYRPEGKLGLHSIQSLREMCDEVYLPPYEANYKVFIIHDADRMLSYSANALLKTFEEPPARTKIILLSHSQTALLPTILSRCATFFFESISQSLIEEYLKQHFPAEDQQKLNSFAHLAQGSLGRAVQLVKRGGDAKRAQILTILSKGKIPHFKMLSEQVQKLVEEVEANRKVREDEIKEFHKESLEHLTAASKAVLEKEIEGASSMILAQEAEALFGTIISWYRDLHLLEVMGDRNYLINSDYTEKLEQAFQRGQSISLEYVLKVVDEAKLSLQRSVALNICLENLLLKLNVQNIDGVHLSDQM